jgi:hypothetical protein
MILPGSVVTISATFTATGTGVATDPTLISIELIGPDGTEYGPYTYAAAQVSRSAAGAYYYDFTVPEDADSHGTWLYRWEGTSPAAGVMEGKFNVRTSQFVD